MARQTVVITIMFFIVLLSACATTPPTTTAKGDPVEQVNRLEADLKEAKANQVDVLSPDLYEQSRSSLMKAKEAMTKGAKLSSITGYVAEGEASLAKAEENAQVARTVLGDANKARQKALEANAEALGKPYKDVEEQYRRLTRAIEQNDLSYAQNNAPRVQAAFREVEILAIQNNALGEARKVMGEAGRQNVMKVAPNAYRSADEALREAETYIEKNPYNTEEINQQAANAEFMAQRAISVGETSNKFNMMSPEESALYLESMFVSLAGALNAGDLRNKNIETQVNTMIGAADNTSQRIQSLEKEILENQDKIAELEQKLTGVQDYASQQEMDKKKLAAEREFNERFNEVQGYFNPDEAEVYKQGDRLVIRLKSIQFPVGQATLSPENYTLLAKVQRSIQTFEKPMVIVEGHTDSTGSAELNMQLSQERAEAVKTYLIANKTLAEDSIDAVGYGPDRPLAPNTTADGRAMNRRIDVIIAPSQAP